ncbi:MAG: desulfoferrodoxin [Candidatus Moranbacteria bacterium]|nr:desulfoferrodoxin [Candidatus Moranbacteria bacterium]
MTRLNQIYKCDICTNVVEVIHSGAGELVCCGQSMKLMVAKTKDQGQEKHTPVVEKTQDQLIVKIGSIPHPMESEHYIEWIELLFDNKVKRQYLKPGQEPKAIFSPPQNKATVRAYCNVHGLWHVNI